MAIGPTSKVVVTLDVEAKQLLEKIANGIAPDVEKLKLDAECSSLAQLLGSTQGFYTWLKEIIDDPNAMSKAQKLRELCARSNELTKLYAQQLANKQKEREEKFPDES